MDVIHRLDQANFSGFMYTQVFTTTSTAIVLNGTSITLAPPTQINVEIHTLSAATPANVFVLGRFMPNNSTSAWDIKTGQPV